MNREALAKWWMRRRYYSRAPAWLGSAARGAVRAGLAVKDRICEPPRMLLLMAHIRSGSTLLNHLLLSHPDFMGAGERLATYASTGDLEALRLDAHFSRGQLLRAHRYAVDQINHNELLASAELLNDARVRTVFLIREPAASIASMMKMMGSRGWSSTQDATDYYLDRLAELGRSAQAMARRDQAFALTYGDLTASPRALLDRLGAFLGLDTPLPEEYRTFGFTGIRGDPSPNIRAGRILASPAGGEISLEAATLEALRSAYERCWRALGASCTT